MAPLAPERPHRAVAAIGLAGEARSPAPLRRSTTARPRRRVCRPVDLLLHLFLVTYLPDDILTKTDRASMFNSLEVRAPFLDRRFAEYACALPTGLKLRGGTRKYILKRLARRYLPPGDRRSQKARLCRADRGFDPHPLSRAMPRRPAVAHEPGCRLVRARCDRSAARRTPGRPARPRQEAVGALHPVLRGRASGCVVRCRPSCLLRSPHIGRILP